MFFTDVEEQRLQQQKEEEVTTVSGSTNPVEIEFDSNLNNLSLPAPPSEAELGLQLQQSAANTILPCCHDETSPESKAQRTGTWISQPYAGSTLPPLDDPSTILTSPVMSRKNNLANAQDPNPSSIFS